MLKANAQVKTPIRIPPIALLILMPFSFLNPMGCIQERILFPRQMAPDPIDTPPIHPTFEWKRERTLGGTGVAWYIPTLQAARNNPRPCVVFFHGNAEIIDYQSDLVLAYRQLGCSTLLPEYPGYGRSTGFPSEASIVDDAEYFYNKLLEQPDVDRHRIIFHGRSIGGAVAAQLATRHEPAALILQSTFTSVPAMAGKYLMPSFLVRHPFHTDRAVAAITSPILIFHGSQDRIVPVSHGRTLRDLSAKSKEVRYVEYNCGHNDFPGDDTQDYLTNIRQFLETQNILRSTDNP